MEDQIAGDATQYVTLNYLTLRTPESFFIHGRPDLDPKRSPGLLGRPFDFFLISGILTSTLVVTIHLVIMILTLPSSIKPSNITISQCGTYEGVWNSDQSVLRYWSIPYAASPVLDHEQKYGQILADLVEKKGYRHNHLRWMSTVDSDDETYCFLSFDERCTYARSQYECKMTRSASRRSCIEVGVSDDIMRNASEDCLTLDLAMPGFYGQPLPVVVIFTGFRTYRNPMDKAKIGEPAYTPSDDVVIQSKAIWIRPRYRLGLFGLFKNIAQLWKQESRFANYALLDQIAVLKWIQANIERFGGDPKMVTLLGHGSGATSALALVEWQSKQNSDQTWFQKVWLASGSVNWLHSDDTLPGRLSHMLLGKCESGYDPEDVGLSKYCEEKIEEIHQLPPANLAKHLNGIWNEALQIKSMLDISETSQQIGWFSSNLSFPSNAPIDWSQKAVKDMFESKSQGARPKLDLLIFSSVSEEFNGFPGTELFDRDDNAEIITQYSKALKSYRKSSSPDPFTEAWLAESKYPIFRFKQRSKTNFVSKILSGLRYTCPHNFILRKWLTYLSKTNLERTKFYQIYHEQSPQIPYRNVPGPAGAMGTTSTFHGYDLLLLTGQVQDIHPATEPYRKLLTNIFLNVVHSKPMTESCEVTEYSAAYMGCQLTSKGVKQIKSSDSISVICNSIDWDTYFQKLAFLE